MSSRIREAKSGISQKMHKRYYVYILTSDANTVLYVGITSNLPKRIWQHKEGVADGFTKEYNVKKLVYFEIHEIAEAAIKREKQIKKWKRSWKENLINKDNRKWRDLYPDILL